MIIQDNTRVSLTKCVMVANASSRKPRRVCEPLASILYDHRVSLTPNAYSSLHTHVYVCEIKVGIYEIHVYICMYILIADPY